MVILQVLHQFLPKYVGGLEVYTYDLSIELGKRHQVYIFCGVPVSESQISNEEDMEYNGLKIKSVSLCSSNDAYNMAAPFKEGFFVDRLSQYLKQLKPDIVHIQHCESLPVATISIAKKYSKNVVVTMHDYSFLCPKGFLPNLNSQLCEKTPGIECLSCIIPNPFSKVSGIVSQSMLNGFANLCYKFIPGTTNNGKSYTLGTIRTFRYRIENMREKLMQADIVIAPSKALRYRSIACGIPDDHIIHICNGVKPSPIKYTTKKTASKIRFGFIGRIVKIKGVNILIQAFSKLNSEKAELNIYGDIPDEEYFSELKKLSQKPNIHFCGRYEPNQVYELLSNIDVLVVPSICLENMPLVVLEALASKTPVIASNVGGAIELIDNGKNGFLFMNQDIDDLCDKMNLVLTNPNILQSLYDNIKPVKTTEQNTQEVESVYLKLLQAV
jgi:glycosyltransferase involved in cell wall biosynthesis